MNCEILLKHNDSVDIGSPLPQKWVEHGYSTLAGMFALRAFPEWEVTTQLENDYILVKIHGSGTQDEALAMVAKVVKEQDSTIPGLGLMLHKRNV